MICPLNLLRTFTVLASGTLVPRERMFLCGTRDCCGEVALSGTLMTFVCEILSVCEALSVFETLFVCGETCFTSSLFNFFAEKALVCFCEGLRVSVCFGTL